MKNFEFLLCFLLCVIPCVFTENIPEQIRYVERIMEITPQDLLKCLSEVNTDLGTIYELGHSFLHDDGLSSQENVTKVGCFIACISKKNGVLVNSKIVPERIMKLAKQMDEDKQSLALLSRTVKECNKQVSSRTDDCDIIVYFSRCVVQGMNRDE